MMRFNQTSKLSNLLNFNLFHLKKFRKTNIVSYNSSCFIAHNSSIQLILNKLDPSFIMKDKIYFKLLIF